jgi:hypothetical protein
VEDRCGCLRFPEHVNTQDIWVLLSLLYNPPLQVWNTSALLQQFLVIGQCC